MRIIKTQTGVALLSALLLMTICVILATFFLINSRLLLRQANLVKGNDDLQIALQGVQEWAVAAISSNVDLHKIHDLALDYHGIKIHGRIYALSGRFNLNSLQIMNNMDRFIILLRAVEPALTAGQAEQLALALNQWQQYKTQNENYYLEQQLAYRAAHQRLVSVSELRLVRGFNSKLYNKLLPYVAALPDGYYRVNVNYATAPVFATLGNLTETAAQSLVRCRGNHYFNSVDEFIQQCGANIKNQQAFLTTENDYYLIVGRAVRGDQTQVVQTLLRGGGSAQHAPPTLIWQAFNDE